MATTDIVFVAIAGILIVGMFIISYLPTKKN